MKAIVICTLIALSIVSTIALMPVSSWVFRNQVDLLARRNPNPQGGEDDMSSTMPNWLMDPKTYAGSDQAEQFARALFTPYPSRVEALERFAKEHPQDPVGWAVLVRMICVAGGSTPDWPRNKAAESKKVDGNFEVGYQACLRGESLEPKNAYFPLMRAAFDVSLDKLDDMPLALKAAAAKSEFDHHFREETALLEQAIKSAKGYRGELIQTGIVASTEFPDFAHMKSMARYLNRKGTLSEKRDLIQAEYTSCRGEDVAIGLLVAFANVRLTLEDPIPIPAPSRDGSTHTVNERKTSEEEWQRLATEFDAKLLATHLVPPVPSTLEIYQTLHRLAQSSERYFKSISPGTSESTTANTAVRLAFIEAFVPCVALVALVFSVLFARIGWLFTRIRSETFRAMAPHLICLPIWFAAVLLTSPCDCSEFPMAGLLFGIAQLVLAFLRLDKRPAMILTGAIALILPVIVYKTSLVLSGLAWATVAFCLFVAILPWLVSVDNRNRISMLAGAALVAASLAIKDGPVNVAGIAFAIALGLAWINKSDKAASLTPWVTLIVFFVMIVGASALFTIDQIRRATPATDLAGIAILATCLGALFTPKVAQATRTATCIGLTLFSLVYLVSVGAQIRANHVASLSGTNILDEAREIRKIAGMN